MDNQYKLSRRHFFQKTATLGVGAGIGALTPLSSAMANPSNNSNTKFFFINFADGYPNGTWYPSGENGNLTMNDCTKDLDAYKDNIVFFTGVNNHFGAGHDGWRGLWRESQSQNSIDVEMANAYSEGLPKRAVRLGVDSNYWGHGGRQPSLNSDSSVGNAHEDDPQRVFDNLFAPVFSTPGEAQDKADRDRAKIDILAKSIDDVRILKNNLGSLEQNKLNAFETAAVQAQTELENSLNGQTGVCSNIFSGTSYGRDQRADLQVANAAMALGCGQTKIVSLQLGTSNDSKAIETFGGGPVPHDASHWSSATKPTYIAHRQWYLSKVLKLIEHLKLQPDTNGNMFDNTVIFVTSEMGDGNAHSNRELPVLLIGGNNTRLNTQSGGKIYREVGPIGRILRSYADAYSLSHSYSSSPISGLFS
ncbi:DUF1552 domain-containing protein [Vibrio sp. SS-MA-C1-2]|uniref:DUF1552 domain-containing protein n=1 Tax=Vibrio sp. SS-MA-C1-2 TaxID=2908646 RepID=UPI001F40801D|nr:DUF1552 domain-containing protein [Vibrio sp. SS-MA-C1-2]UJF17790.1 DUF1552 domain-containing protein [Vibrio sp. SS-MA-C1-2]